MDFIGLIVSVVGLILAITSLIIKGNIRNRLSASVMPAAASLIVSVGTLFIYMEPKDGRFGILFHISFLCIAALAGIIWFLGWAYRSYELSNTQAEQK